MVSEFDKLYGEIAAPVIMDYFADRSTIDGEAMVIVHAKDGPPSDQAAAIVGVERTELRESNVGQTRIRTRQITLHVDSVPPIKLSDQVELRGELWAVDDIDNISAAFVTLTTTHVGRIELTRPAFRRTE